jgi:hypothetical protein
MGFLQKNGLVAAKWYRTLKKHQGEAKTYPLKVTGLKTEINVLSANKDLSAAFLYRPLPKKWFFLFIKEGPTARFFEGQLFEFDPSKPSDGESAWYNVTELITAMPKE